MRAVFAPLDVSVARRLGTAVAALLTADALLHAVWTTGLTWPADDSRGLSYAVLNADVPFTPRILLPLCALLTTAAAAVYAHAHALGGPLLRRASRLVTMAVAGGLSVRAAAGVGWVFGIGSPTDAPFYRLNLLLYTPVCVAFGYAAARLAATATGGARTDRRAPVADASRVPGVRGAARRTGAVEG